MASSFVIMVFMERKEAAYGEQLARPCIELCGEFDMTADTAHKLWLFMGEEKLAPPGSLDALIGGFKNETIDAYDAVCQLAAASPALQLLLSANSGVNEGYRLHEHTQAVMNALEQYFIRDFPDSVDRKILRTAALFQDIGKSLCFAHCGSRKLQEVYNAAVLGNVLDSVSTDVLTKDERRTIRALCGQNVLGKTMQGLPSSENMYDIKETVSTEHSANCYEFMRALYLSDITAYTSFSAYADAGTGQRVACRPTWNEDHKLLECNDDTIRFCDPLQNSRLDYLTGRHIKTEPPAPRWPPMDKEVIAAMRALKKKTQKYEGLSPASPDYLCLNKLVDRQEYIANVRILERAFVDIRREKYGGRWALEVYDYVWRHLEENRRLNLYYHGTPLHPDQLEGSVLRPNQPLRSHPLGALFAHGSPGVCVSKSYEEPILLALFQTNSEVIKAWANQPGAFSVQRHVALRSGVWNPENTQGIYHITTEATLQFLKQHNASGYVYAIRGRLPLTLVREGEYRFSDPVTYEAVVRVTTEDLPPDLLVLDGNAKAIGTFQEAWNNLGSPIAAMAATGIQVRMLRGWWPEQFYRPRNRTASY